MNNEITAKLRQLGLTDQEIKIYTILLDNNRLSAKVIAERISILPNAVYRTGHKLSKMGFIAIIKNYPTIFQAIPLQTSAPAFIEKQTEMLQKLTNDFANTPLEIEHNSYPTNINLIYGANTIYEEGAKLLDSAKHEMLVISIGEPIPPNLLLSVKQAKDRGVSIKMIVHKYDEENKTVLENLKKNGYIIRYSPGSGFHIAVYDQKKSLLIINNPKDTSEKVAMLINSSGLSKALCDYFHSTWQKATKV